MARLSITALPDDVLVAILCFMEPEDVATMRATCILIQRATRIKQVWMYFLDSLVQKYGIPLPVYCRPLDDLCSDEVETLVAHFMRMLRKRHLTTTVPHRNVRIVCVDQPRPVTWVKLVRDQWALVACSDADTSSLLLFDIDSLKADSKSPVSVVYFPGPILAGEVYTTENSVTIAVDVRTRPVLPHTPSLVLISI
ncbi:hypothetical protein PsYK624_148680 [Phanerochaete sordida]|uniref:F-box domain-containing protein n=1 Tax=Phanerochaete sordida TaxID=48140 RepID=A0A9P3LLF4_9APHY|nr:hypothetical protein PsYK624_148680 [Phanerochaete sordida]